MTQTATRPSEPKFTEAQARALHQRAHEAGMAALEALTPTPMVVGSPTHFLGSDVDPRKPTYVVPTGVCGFAWVWLPKGNTSFARQWKRVAGATAAYGGGISLWVRQGGQSMEKKEAYARAYASVLGEAGVRAYAQSRMD